MFGIDHTPPVAPLAMVALLVAGALLERRPARAPAGSELPPVAGRYHPGTG